MKKILSILLTLGLLAASQALADKPSLGFVLVGPKNDGGWSMRHYQGFKSLEKYGYKSTFVEMVVEADSERVFRKLARKHDVVFGTSFGYMDPMAKVAKKHADTLFMHATGYKTAANMDNYNCRLYQVRYLAGIAAGMLTKTNKIGVVGSHPIPEIISNINALTLGAQSVNPQVEVNVIWINSWFDPPKDMEAAKTVHEWGADVFFTTTDSPNVITLAQKNSTAAKPLWGMGNDAPMNSFGPDRYATGPMFNWNVLYKHILDKVAAGNYEVETPFWGLKENCVGLSPWGPNVPGTVVNHVETVKMKWINDEMDDNFPFSAGFTKQDGSSVGPGMKRGGIESMDYHVKGVVSAYPIK